MAPKQYNFVIENDEQARLIITYKILNDLTETVDSTYTSNSSVIEDESSSIVMHFLHTKLTKIEEELDLNRDQILHILGY